MNRVLSLDSTMSTRGQRLRSYGTRIKLGLLVIFVVLTLGKLHVGCGVVTIGLLVPHSGARSFGPEIEVTMDMAIEKANTSPDLFHLREENITFRYLTADTRCDIGQGLYELVQMNNQVDAFIGPACDSLCIPAGLLAGKWNKPMLSYSCYSKILSDRQMYPTFARTSAQYVEMANFIVDFINIFHWDRITVIQGPEAIWGETVAFLQPELESYGVQTDILSIPSNDPHDVLEKHLISMTRVSRVFIIATYGADVLYVMCAAQSGGLLNGEHVFMSIDFVFMTEVQLDNRPCNRHGLLDGLLDLTMMLDESYRGYQTLMEKLKDTLGSIIHGNEYGIRSGMVYDAVYLYALGLDRVLHNGDDPTNGTNIINTLLDHTFQGVTGEINLDRYGTRRASFALYNIVQDEYMLVASGNISHDSIIFEDNVPIRWPGGSTTPPLGRPECGWDGEFCEETNRYIPLFTATGMVLLLLVTLSSGMAFYMYRSTSTVFQMLSMYVSCSLQLGCINKKFRKNKAFCKYKEAVWGKWKKKIQELMESMSWKISYDDLDFKGHGHTTGSIMSTSKNTFHSYSYSKSPDCDIKSKRTNSIDSGASFCGQVFIKIAMYKGQTLSVKSINKAYIAVTPSLIKEINEIRHLNHRNINALVGACTDPMRTCLLSVYCQKGSLQDVLGNDDIKLDQIFKVSFASDIAKGMYYIHSSCIKSHGHLKSSNVFIDQNWTCKIGDIGMPVFREGERPFTPGDVRRNYQLLWTAPELLHETEITHKGTQKGDVYAYGIILQEIVLRTVPYGYMNIDPEDIIAAVREKQSPPFRPIIPPVETIHVLDDIMRMCWEEVPLFRPNFTTIMDSLKKLFNGKTTNLVDQMVHMMAKYADHLEELVKERTEQLEVEQKRTEELLCRMLPRTIANDLKSGKSVNPETYESVTIYFSDIVGFTTLSSHSTPMEIVNFLNDLYTCFDTILEDYDVYKVETIGDAYMVVSGLPVRNENKHAGEIASMSLDLLSSVTNFSIRHMPLHQLQIRIGIHSGQVCAGVVGLKMPRYCLFGDTVNYASRMESSGLALRIHVSPECKEILEELDGFYFECRGTVYLKGKGHVQTYWLLGRQGFSKQMPDQTLAAPIKDHEFK